MADYKLTNSTGVIRTTDNAFIPEDTRNKDWNSYQEWLADSNTPDAADTPDLTAYKALVSSTVRAEGQARRQAAAGLLYTVDLLRFREASVAVGDGSPTAPEYPLLDAQAQAESSSIATVATAVVAEELAWRTAAAPVEQAMREGLVAIAAASDAAGVDAAVAAITWP